MTLSHSPHEFWMPEKGLEDPCFRGVLDFWFHRNLNVFDNSNPKEILELTRKLNIQSVIYSLLRKRGISLANGHETFQILRKEALQIAGACAYRHHTIEMLSNRFDRAGIKPIWIKGPSLACTVYPYSDWRTYKDFDLLIAPDDWNVAVQVMEDHGYSSTTCLNWGFFSFEKSFRALDDIPESVDVELHCRLSNRARLCVFSFDELTEDASDASSLSFPFLIPHPVKHFIFVCLHRIGHHPHDRRFTWLMDMMYLVNQFSDNDWEKVIEYSKSKKVSKIILQSLIEVKDIFPVIIPGEVINGLKKQSGSQLEPSEVFLTTHRSKWIDLWTRWWEMPGAFKKIDYLLHWMIPPDNYMDENFGRKSFLEQHKDRFLKALKKYFWK